MWNVTSDFFSLALSQMKIKEVKTIVFCWSSVCQTWLHNLVYKSLIFFSSGESSTRTSKYSCNSVYEFFNKTTYCIVDSFTLTELYTYNSVLIIVFKHPVAFIYISHTLYTVFIATLQVWVLSLLLYDMFWPHWAIIRRPACQNCPTMTCIIVTYIQVTVGQL
jgi:hypothetical protein